MEKIGDFLIINTKYKFKPTPDALEWVDEANTENTITKNSDKWTIKNSIDTYTEYSSNSHYWTSPDLVELWEKTSGGPIRTQEIIKNDGYFVDNTPSWLGYADEFQYR